MTAAASASRGCLGIEWFGLNLGNRCACLRQIIRNCQVSFSLESLSSQDLERSDRDPR